MLKICFVLLVITCLNNAHGLPLSGSNWKTTKKRTKMYIKDYYKETIKDAKTHKVSKFAENTLLSNWHHSLKKCLSPIRLTEMLIPRAHNAGSYGINKNSPLINTNSLLGVAASVFPDIVANWSRTQTIRPYLQAKLGIRAFDLRPVRMSNGVFRWWHGLAGNTVNSDLKELRKFSQEHRSEILLLIFENLIEQNGNSMSSQNRTILYKLLIEELNDVAIPFDVVGGLNATMSDLWKTGKSVIIGFRREKLISKIDKRFWYIPMDYNWKPKSNPEDLFKDRSQILRQWKENITNIEPNKQIFRVLSVANTGNERQYLSTWIKTYSKIDYWRELAKLFFPEILKLKPKMMGFEGLFTSMTEMTDRGTNTGGMRARPPHLYSSGASVHYRGVNDMLRYWLSRPQLFALNMIDIDSVASSTAVNTIIDYYRGDLKREVVFSFQGNAMDGYYEWDSSGLTTLRGNESLNCATCMVRYSFSTSMDAKNVRWRFLEPKTELSITNDLDENLILFVEASASGRVWSRAFSMQIGVMLYSQSDYYIRGFTGNFTDNIFGKAYITTEYDSYGKSCDQLPTAGRYISIDLH